MKKVFFILCLFSFLSKRTYPSGLRLDARANFLGQSELKLLGDRIVSNPGGLGVSEITKTAKDNIGFTFVAGYEKDLNKRLSLLTGVSYVYHKTKEFNLDYSTDNSSIEGHAFTLNLSGQFNFLGGFFIETGVSFPVLSRYEGFFDNQTGVDKVDLEGRLGFDFSLGYRIVDFFRVSLGYAMAHVRKEKALTGVDITLENKSYFLSFHFVF